jgi:hypothetical protein
MRQFVAALIGASIFIPTAAIAEDTPQTLEQRCTSDEASSYEGVGVNRRYIYDVQNKCQMRLRCDLNISILNAFGLKHGHKVLIIGPNSHEALIVKVRVLGGLNQRDYTCKEI